eukprot:m.76602 g.76602  ORF g.76602 m.76602 type:complete len:228 (+) comp36003_c1_seq2:3379-4062(+)
MQSKTMRTSPLFLFLFAFGLTPLAFGASILLPTNLDQLNPDLDGFVTGAPRASSGEELEESEVETDCCEKWINCSLDVKEELDAVFKTLPDCPCIYFGIPYDQMFHDRRHNTSFKWREDNCKLDLYYPTAKTCIEHIPDDIDFPAQHCCYDYRGLLITRGCGAGTPRLASKLLSPQMHLKFDRKPWLDCKGDWRKYQSVRPPNNGRKCLPLPPDNVLELERQAADSY